MDAASRLALLRPQLASLRQLIRRIESGEEAARLRRILAEIGQFPAESEAEVSARLTELDDPAARKALLAVLDDQAKSLERRLARPPAVAYRTRQIRPTSLQDHVTAAGHSAGISSSAAEPTARHQPPDERRPGAWHGAIASGGALVAAAVFWAAIQVVFAMINENADHYFERYDWMILPFAASLVCAFLAGLAFITASRGGLPVWTLIVASAAIAVPAFGPEFIFWPSLGVAVLLVAVLATIGERRPRPRPRVAAGVMPGFAAAAVGLALVPAVAVGFYSHSGEVNGDRASEFCDTHACIANFESGKGSVVQCGDGQWSQSGGRPGACSHHGGVADGTTGSSNGTAVSARAEGPAATETDSDTTGQRETTPDTVSPAAPDTASLEASAEQFLSNYYSDLDGQDFARAWGRLGASLRTSFGSYDAWRAGYDNTISQRVSDIAATVTGSAATVTLTLRATDIDVCADSVRQRFAQTWALTRAESRWQAIAVTARKVSGRTPAQSTDECELESIAPPPAPYTGDEADDDCPYLSCTEDFENGRGSVVRCSDGTWSHSGGIQGACSHHGGVDDGYSAPSYDESSSGRSPSVGGGTVHVDGYFRDDGTYVRPHTRRAPCTYC